LVLRFVGVGAAEGLIGFYNCLILRYIKLNL